MSDSKTKEVKVNQQEPPATALGGYHAENFRRRTRCAIVFAIMIAAFAVVIVININSGNVHISVGEIAKAIFLREGQDKVLDIIWTIRLPRIIVSMLLGGALALAGFLLQTFFENPIAGWGFPPAPRWWSRSP